MFCKKCGNKLKEEFKFCDKCGAKVEQIKEVVEEKKKTPKEAKKEDVVPLVEKPVIKEKKKTGKGKIVFLSIMNIILLGTTITFLVLWLTKPTNSTNTNYSDDKKETSKKDDKKDDKKDTDKTPNYVGKWENNVDYKEDGKVVLQYYSMLELKSDKTFKYVSYDKENTSDKETIEGTYTVLSDGKTFTLTYKEKGSTEKVTAYLENSKLCLNTKNCKDYLLKDNPNNKIVINKDTAKKTSSNTSSSIKKIINSEYNRIISNKESAIVVVVHEGCAWCEKFEPVIEKIYKEYDTSFYYYENDGKLDVSGTPTTFIIKDGKVVEKVVGYKDYNSFKTILDNNKIK